MGRNALIALTIMTVAACIFASAAIYQTLNGGF